MRLLTHNVMRNNASAASSAKSPPRITAATKVRVDESAASASSAGGDDDDDFAAASRREVEFARHVLPILDWESLVQAASAMGLMSLPPSVSTDLAEDEGFLRALYHVLMNVHLVDGMLTCEVTGREFPVTDGIVNMMLEEHECE
jgi:multifunctional methyltransferase subunit TRM112